MCVMRGPRNGGLNMELLITCVSNCVVRLVILYLTTKNEITREVYQNSETFGNGILTEQQVSMIWKADESSKLSSLWVR